MHATLLINVQKKDALSFAKCLLAAILGARTETYSSYILLGLATFIASHSRHRRAHLSLILQGWWQGEFNGEVGLFPANYVELIE